MPDATERVTLKMGKCRFPLDCSASPQELCYALEEQYPKHMEGGGFELLRSEEGCPKELVVIPIPDGGYTVDYLTVIVHNAKLYIRPLQSDLSLEPRSSDVSIHTKLVHYTHHVYQAQVCAYNFNVTLL